MSEKAVKVFELLKKTFPGGEETPMEWGKRILSSDADVELKLHAIELVTIWSYGANPYKIIGTATALTMEISKWQGKTENDDKEIKPYNIEIKEV
jgi:hypothetical protein